MSRPETKNVRATMAEARRTSLQAFDSFEDMAKAQANAVQAMTTAVKAVKKSEKKDAKAQDKKKSSEKKKKSVQKADGPRTRSNNTDKDGPGGSAATAIMVHD